MARRNTKEIILSEALKLFADKGYDGVTVRDIAEKVNVQQSSLYKHYKSKEEILDSIFTDMKQHYKNVTKEIQLPMDNDFSELAKKYQSVGLDGLKQICTAIFLYWLTDEKGSQFRRLLILEQFRHSEAEKLLREFLLDGVLEYQTTLFAEMIKCGYFENADPQVLSLEFYSPIFLLLCKYDGQVDKKDEAVKILNKFVEDFDRKHRKRV